MKKFLCIAFLSLLIPVLAVAQSLYFDIGLGFGSAVTEVDGSDVADSFPGAEEVAVDIGLKLGVGPIAGSPLYIAGVFEGIGHRFYDDYNYIQFNAYLLGPSVIYYPIPLLQLSGSFGYSYIYTDNDLGLVFRESESGYAYDVAAALDLGSGNNGILLGLKYFRAVNTIETTKAEEVSSMVSLFAKYAYRQK